MVAFWFDDRMEPVEFGPLTEELREQLEADEEDPWDAARVPPMNWRPKEQHVGLRDQRGRLVASAGLITAEVEVAGQRFQVVGLGGVIVNRDHRGEGLSLRVVEAALAKAASLGPELALLFCHEDRTDLYRRFGFDEVRSQVLVDGPRGQVEMPMHTMWRALRPTATWPQGPVVLHGRPF
ncbi:MAG TPA: GNAT family N-acetyltransferase [Solirubrobacteraceae bacterium]